MKKFLLFGAAALIAASAAAQELVYEIDYSKENWAFYVMGYEPQVVDGVLTSENPGGWYQYFIADQFKTVAGESYTAVIECKASEQSSMNLNLGWGWGEGEQQGKQITMLTDWSNVKVKYENVGAPADGASSNLVLQPGGCQAKIEIKTVKLYLGDAPDSGETPVDPVDGDVIATMYPGPNTFIGWGGNDDVEGSQFVGEQVEVDGRQAYKITHEAACHNPWEAQFAFDADYEPGTTYFFTLDVKGDPGTITSAFQCTDGWVGCGDVESFDITPDWTTVTVKGTPTSPDGKLPNRWVANVGSYVGTFYMSNVTIATSLPTAVETIAPVKVNTAVYNLQGVKVADSIDEVAAPGLYITNGKKVIKK